MNITDETLIAYADGELTAEDARAVDAELEKRADLREFVERQRALRAHIQASFAPILAEPVPDRLLRALTQAPVSPRWRLSHAIARAADALAQPRFLLWTGLPAAAALACGILIGIAMVPVDILGVRHDGGTIAAQGALASALDRQLASAQDARNLLRIGLSFRAKDGRYCRTFENAGTLSGVACRDVQGWSVAALAASSREENAGDYHMAGSTMPDAIRNMVAAMIAGEPLDAAAERRARDAGWR